MMTSAVLASPSVSPADMGQLLFNLALQGGNHPGILQRNWNGCKVLDIAGESSSSVQAALFTLLELRGG